MMTVGRSLAKWKLWSTGPMRLDQLVVDDVDDLLAGVDGADDLLADRPAR